MQKCLEYCENYWHRIIKVQKEEDQTLIGLPYPYLVPNHQMFQEMYYWDTYFMCLGLIGGEREELIHNCTDNLIYMQKRFGRIPNTSRYYHLSRSQPPFLSHMIELSLRLRLRSNSYDENWLVTAYTQAKLEYQKVWNGSVFPDYRLISAVGLSRYYDIDIWHNAAEAESGWDMTPRFDNHCLNFCPIDLNSILYSYAINLAQFAQQLGLKEEQSMWTLEAQNRKDSIFKYCQGEDGFFYDYDFLNHKRSSFLSMAGFFPLWCKLLTETQARKLVDENLGKFETDFGIVTTEFWEPQAGEEHKQWAWPNGWAPLQWVVVSGLMNYGFIEEAQRIAKKWVSLVDNIFTVEGCNFEKYDVVHGCRAVPDRYEDQIGFGWTNAIFIRFCKFLESGELLS